MQEIAVKYRMPMKKQWFIQNMPSCNPSPALLNSHCSLDWSSATRLGLARRLSSSWCIFTESIFKTIINLFPLNMFRACISRVWNVSLKWNGNNIMHRSGTIRTLLKWNVLKGMWLIMLLKMHCLKIPFIDSHSAGCRVFITLVPWSCVLTKLLLQLGVPQDLELVCSPQRPLPWKN